ncbi:MAG: DUF2723 domain-containing protein [Actinobacteria bacterium]|nr:DUF2723 domain-containing protein [Actinomycetota bacterium]
MQNYKLTNRIFAGVAFVLSLIVYLKTIAPTVSFWDCGEFITCSYILGVPHPPGAPLFLLIGRIFTMLPLATDIALRVNIISSIASALTVMLTYLIIVRFIKQWRGEPKNSDDVLILTASGLIGALAYAFTDTFWFNAVEAEVYAISMFFTSIIVWLILVWLEKADEKGSERYILIIAYLVGLAMGVHLLMILTLPAVFMVVYFKYLEKTGQKITFKNLAAFVAISAAIFIAIYPGIVQWVPNIAGKLGVWFIFAIIIALFIGVYYAVSGKQKIMSLALMSALLVIIGYSTYAGLMIRSKLNPAIDENNPETMEGMVRYLNREQYGSWGTFPRRYPGLLPEWQFHQQYSGRSYATFNLGKQLNFMWNYQIKKMYWRYFGWQFIGKGKTLGPDHYIAANFTLLGLLGLPFLLGLIGMVHHFYRHWRHASVISALFLLTGLAIVIYLNQENPQPRERDYVFVGSFFAFALWIGMGVSAILEWIQEAFREKNGFKKTLFWAVIAAFTIMVPINLLAHNYHEHNRSGNYVAYDYSYNILQTCEPNGILFTNGDNDTFPLWFLQEVYGIRKDVRVVNLSLLNTPWYIKQLKHGEPRVPISLTDEQIDRIELAPWKTQTIKIPVPKSIRGKALADVGERKGLEKPDEKFPSDITIKVKPTVFNQAIRVQDLMILNILYANQWRKPVYFAVTVSRNNKLGLDKYLRMDGQCFKLVPFENERLSTEKMEKYLFKIYKFRGLDNPKVYFNNNIKGLLQNYRAAFLGLAQDYLMSKKYDKMVRVLDRMETVMPFDIIPVPDARLLLQVGQMYDLAGKSKKFLEYTEMAMEMSPDNAYVYGTLVSLYSRAGRHQDAVDLLNEWLKRHPDDKQATLKMQEEQKLLKSADSSKVNAQG